MPRLPVDKPALRRALRARRAALRPELVAAASGSLTAVVLAHPAWQSARSVAAFVGVDREPDTGPLLQAALDQGRRLWLPRVLDGRGGRSLMVEVSTLAHLAPAPFGLLEPPPPSDGANELALPSIPPDAPIDLVLVPGLAFASTGARIGFGAGHYDRLLAPSAHASRPVRIGLCFAAFLDPPEGPIPMAAHDVPMHWIATEAGAIPCPASTSTSPHS
ncbi:5-formyltetrahydrofolate cyclo-ligase [Paraliomyxa miuraensis]|uniref:5-formyltetrahydrofolate cyclo-ligase n=1 Tax=Paraliomyxa miuraensis TaxID=376150 RepID=UPI00224D2C4E|nr:5-formyltetrahydrofolate cyclo-ligase [Paraliomyxa miuraensis]